MANLLPTSNLVVAKALSILKERLIYRALTYNGMSNEAEMGLAHQVGETVNIRKPGNFIAKDFESTVVAQDIKGGTIPVTLDYLLDVTVNLSAKEQKLFLQDYTEQVVRPAMIALANKVDRRVCNHIFQYSQYIVAGTGDTTEKLVDIAAVGLKLEKALAPEDSKFLVLSPTHKYRYALKDALSKASYAGSNKTLLTATLGQVYGMDTLYTTITPESASATNGTAIGTFSVESSATANEVKITNLSSATATIKKGEGFCYNDRRYTFMEDKTGAASAIVTVKVVSDDGIYAYDSVSAVSEFPLLVAATSVKMIRGATSIALHKDAFSFVSVPLDNVGPNQGADIAVASEDGLSVRVTRWYDASAKTFKTSFDCLCGIATIRAEHSVVIQDQF